MKEIFVLLADGSGTMSSSDTPWGAAVTTEKEAKSYVKKGGIGHTHSYAKLKVFEKYDDAREAIYGKRIYLKGNK